MNSAQTTASAPVRPHRLHRGKAGVVVIDIQEKLLPAIHEKDRLLKNAGCLLKAATILGVPIFGTEQYPKGLGRTVPEIRDACPGVSFLEKVAFSSCGASGFVDALASRQVADVILCGMETHVCVLQTALDLVENGFQVFVAADAVSSRAVENHQLGLQRMRDAGAVIVSVEMAVFELLGKAGTAEFKQVIALLK